MLAQDEDKDNRDVTFFRFEDLRIYHKSLDYINWLNETFALYPVDDKTQLVERWSQSARNITFLLAEGSSRNKTQFIYYLKMAKTAIRECLICTSIAFNAANISKDHDDISRGFLMEMTKMIGALISSLQRSGSGNHNQNGNDYPGYGNSRGNYDENPSDSYPNHNSMGY
jgi:four helix bundle protein